MDPSLILCHAPLRSFHTCCKVNSSGPSSARGKGHQDTSSTPESPTVAPLSKAEDDNLLPSQSRQAPNPAAADPCDQPPLPSTSSSSSHHPSSSRPSMRRTVSSSLTTSSTQIHPTLCLSSSLASRPHLAGLQVGGSRSRSTHPDLYRLRHCLTPRPVDVVVC